MRKQFSVVGPFSTVLISLGLGLSIQCAPAQASPVDNLAASYSGVLHSTKDPHAENVPVVFQISQQYNNIRGTVQASGITLPISGVIDNNGQMILTGSIVDKKRRTNLQVSGQARVSATGEFMTLVVSQIGKLHGKKEMESLLMSLTADRPSAQAKKGKGNQVPPNLGNDYTGKYHSSSYEAYEDVDVTFSHSDIPATGQFTGQLTLNGVAVAMTCQVYRAGVVLGQGRTIDPSSGLTSTFTFNGLISAKGTYMVGFGLFNSIVNGQAVQDGAGLSLHLPTAP